MNNYTIYCTKEQTRKALELGAPIQFPSINGIMLGRYIKVENNNEVYEIPTTEQMIGWLEEQEVLVDVEMRTGIVYVYDRKNKVYIKTINIITHKEATLAGIDVALDYLNKNSK